MTVDNEFNKPHSTRYSDELARTEGGTPCRTSEATRATEAAAAGNADTREGADSEPRPPGATA